MAKTIDQKPVHEHRNATDVREKAQNEYRDRMQRSSEREGRRAKATQLAAALWKRLVHAVGEGEARGSMRLVMGSRRPGPRPTDDANALKRHIYMHIRTSPPGQSDDVIANRILGRNPSYVQCQSGDVIIVDNVIGEPDLTDSDDPIVAKRSMTKSQNALKKEISRLRKWAIEEDLLPREYAPRRYYRD